MAAIDDKQLFELRRDYSGGMNNRQDGAIIGDTQAILLKNVDITVPGQTTKRPGLTLIEDIGDLAGVALLGFEPSGNTNELLALHGTKLEAWTGSGSFTEHKTDFTSGTTGAMYKAGQSGENDVALIKLDNNNWFVMTQSHGFTDLGSTSGSGSDSPPDSDVGLFFRNRFWILKDNLLYYSDAFPADYSTAFDTAGQNYRLDTGEERALVAIRDQGIVAFGAEQIWALNPSVTPAATDKAELLLDIGCVAKGSVVTVADDVYFLAPDGVRGLFRTQQDKVQTGSSFPLSFPLKEEFESISWSYIDKATAVYFDNKYFLSLPVDASTYNNEVWVFHPTTQAWTVITGWNVSAWAKLTVNGEERLYAFDSNDGKVYRAWSGYDDNGTAIEYDEQGRKNDMGQPLINKSGGEIKIVALAVGDYDLSIQVSIDEADFTTLGTMNLSGSAPQLPQTLPFNLADAEKVTGVFHLDSLGEWREIILRIYHNATNGNDDIVILKRSIVTYANEYQSE